VRRRASASRPAASAARWNAKTNAEAGRTARARGAAPWLAALLLGGLFLAGPAGARCPDLRTHEFHQAQGRDARPDPFSDTH